ncbi:MAG: indole-3-glycerol phosphate synthase TrpC [Nitriliruptorales bacterium]|nr:indole-3-glycerol phosphate synthase TrpC [Nitriliruptorales bacterium]
MSAFLEDLLTSTRARVEAERAAEPIAVVRARVEDRGDAPPSLRDALAAPGVQVIAEIKRASPSKGDLAPDLDARAQARAYATGGAAGISVLTEPERFKGTLDDLRAAAAVGRPVLRKDFIVDAHQVWQAADAGAAAILLIVAALPADDLAALHEEATDAGLETLIEVHDEVELEIALAVGPTIVGVNARDLRTFELDRDAFARLRPSIPPDVVAVAESGVRGPEDVIAAAAMGADAVLVGESLVTATNPTQAVAALVAAGRQAAA